MVQDVKEITTHLNAKILMCGQGGEILHQSHIVIPASRAGDCSCADVAELADSRQSEHRSIEERNAELHRRAARGWACLGAGAVPGRIHKVHSVSPET